MLIIMLTKSIYTLIGIVIAYKGLQLYLLGKRNRNEIYEKDAEDGLLIIIKSMCIPQYWQKMYREYHLNAYQRRMLKMFGIMYMLMGILFLIMGFEK